MNQPKNRGMNDRIQRLRQRSENTDPVLSIERARLVTEAYQLHDGKHSLPVLRALTFRHLMESKTVWIGDDELIVGEKGHAPQAAPSYPELCCHSLQDLEIMHQRATISFKVSEEDKRIQREIVIPFWKGKSIRDRIMAMMSPEWHDAYAAGIFTEFMEQRSPGHTVGDAKLFTKGMNDFKREIAAELAKLDGLNDSQAYEKGEELKAMAICCDAIVCFAHRHAEAARKLAASEKNPQRKAELETIASVCNHVPANAPRNFHEALQGYWFLHLGVTTELNTWDSFCPGRLDQHLMPFYARETADGTLDREKARELLECFWVKFNNQPAPPKVGVTLQESGTYTDFCNMNLGGLTADGRDGVNEMTYLILEVINEMRLLQPSSNIQVSRKNPDRFVIAAGEVIRTGMGQPSVFNADAVVEELVRQGKTLEDARCGGTSGCVEAGAFGKEAYILTGYFNLPKLLELTLHNGFDPRTQKQLGPKTGDPRTFATFEQLLAAYRTQVNHFVDIKIRGNNVIEKLYACHMPAPFLSVLIDDCIRKGQDYNAGGARYNTSYIQGVGIGSITDSLSAIRKHVYEDQKTTLAGLIAALGKNFEGDEVLRQLCLNKTPKYGNDNDVADTLMTRIFDLFYDAVNGRPNMKGGTYRIDMLPTTCHVYFGAVTGALPDGRKAGIPLSEGISPVQGADRHGPTAVIKSAAKMDHLRTGGTLLNQKFSPKVLDGTPGLEKLNSLIRSYFKLDGHHVQFNVIDAATLRQAQENPLEYRDLIVRVAGYSDYFHNLSRSLQDEIIARTEHQGF